MTENGTNGKPGAGGNGEKDKNVEKVEKAKNDNGGWTLSPKIQIQACPFNLSPLSMLLVYCITIFLTSSLYYNWPAIERIMIDDMVFSELCTQKQIENAIAGVVVCEKQRDAIGKLALYIFYSEFLTYGIAGPLTDLIGVYSVLLFGYIFGFFTFFVMFFFHSASCLKLSFCSWGIMGGCIFITSVHFARMFPETTSLANGMIIFFDNLCAILPIIIHKIMKHFRLRYYEAFGTYLLWGIMPSFLLSLLFIPFKIHSRTKQGFSMLPTKLAKTRLWFNLIVFSIPLNCAVFYRKMFSTYFHYNQRLINLFPIILLFVFVPTPFVSVLNQFVGIHITSSGIYILYILSFLCFFSSSQVYGIVSIVFFAIVSSSGEQQVMSYISEHYSEHECTLMGISYGVGFFVGTGLQYVLDLIYKRSTKATVYVIASLISISIFYSIYCHIYPTEEIEGDKASFRIINIILWFIPFMVLCITLTVNSIFHQRKQTMEEFTRKVRGLWHYFDQKVMTLSIVFCSFSFYYVCNSFLVLVSILKVSGSLGVLSENKLCIIFFLSFFILPHLLCVYYVKLKSEHINITVFIGFLALFKITLLYFTNFPAHSVNKYLFSIVLFFYGFTFFLFINMLAYYNIQITYVERLHKMSVLHWGMVLTMMFMLRFFYNSILRYKIAFLLTWCLVFFFFLLFSAILYLYFPYEMDTFFDIRLVKLATPALLSIDKDILTKKNWDDQFYTRITNSSLNLFSFAVLLNLNPDRYIFFSFCVVVIYNFVTIIIVVFVKASKALDSVKALDLFSTVVSLVLFLLLTFYQAYNRGSDLKTNKFYIILSGINFICLSVSSNNSWLRLQFELQNCCCDSFEKCETCKCCCHKPMASDCEFCNKSVTYSDDHKECCCDKKCNDCVCRNLKKIKLPEYTIAFLDTNCGPVDVNYLSFFIGTIAGWILFLIYLSFTKINITFYQC